MEIIETILASLGGVAVVAVGVLPWVSKLVQDRINLKWKQNYQKEIELIKANLNTNQEIIKATLSSYSTGHHYAQERRLKSIEALWESILKIRAYLSPLTTFYSVFLPDEYTTILEKEHYNHLINMFSEEEVLKFSLSIEDIESQRPFIGEYMWGLFFAYRAFMLRMAMLFNTGVKKNDIQEWKNDTHLITILKTSIGEDEFNKLDLNVSINILYAIGLFEQKILIEMNRNITGETASESNLQQAKRIIELTSNTKFNN